MPGNIQQRIAQSLFWIAWSRVGVQILSFLSTLVVARLLNPSDYGLMAMATVWISAMSLLAEMGLGAAIIQFRNLEESELDTCFWLTMGVARAILPYCQTTSSQLYPPTPDLAGRATYETLPGY
jgi:O-antigen/teichoic acid export membrane protein